MSCQSHRALLACALLLLALLPGCGGSTAGSKLDGSVKNTFNLDFDSIEIKRQDKSGTFHAIIVEYIYGKGTGHQRSPVKVVANAPILEGEERNLLTDGSLTRIMPDASQFPKMKEGKIIFDTLGNAGSSVSGRFYVTFEQGSTLNGEFSGTLEQI